MVIIPPSPTCHLAIVPASLSVWLRSFLKWFSEWCVPFLDNGKIYRVAWNALAKWYDWYGGKDGIASLPVYMEYGDKK